MRILYSTSLNVEAQAFVSEPPGHGPSGTGPQTVLVDFVISVFPAFFMSKYFIVEIY
jgi:hypothetical protein